MINSRQKGAAGEREWAGFLRRVWNAVTARRGCQYAGGPDSPDVTGVPGLHFEVKRVERLNIYRAMDQALAECGDNVGCCAHRINNGDWMVTFPADDVLAFVKAINEL